MTGTGWLRLRPLAELRSDMQGSDPTAAPPFPEMALVHRNPSVAALIEWSVQRKEALLADTGALVAGTGARTGRSPRDKFIVRRPASEGRIGWGKVNQPMAPEQ